MYCRSRASIRRRRLAAFAGCHLTRASADGVLNASAAAGYPYSFAGRTGPALELRLSPSRTPSSYGSTIPSAVLWRALPHRGAAQRARSPGAGLELPQPLPVCRRASTQRLAMSNRRPCSVGAGKVRSTYRDKPPTAPLPDNPKTRYKPHRF